MGKQSSSHIEIAEEMLSDARSALEHDFSLRTVEDRAFYGMYHATMEILERIEKAPSTQSGAIALFGKHIVKERGLVDREFHSMLSRHQAKRQEADYEKVFLDDREDAEQFVRDAERFVTEIEAKLEKMD